MKRGGKRKISERSFGEMSDVGASPEDTPRCDYCLLPSGSCPRGRVEGLLSCSDCSAKAHPACLAYTLELAARALRSPWQCPECKTCCVCRKADNPSSLLLCDSCDKGYHMNCVHPPLMDSPDGKWECSTCLAEADDGASQQTLGEDRRDAVSSELEEHTPAPSNINNSSFGDANSNESRRRWTRADVPDVQTWSMQQVHEYFTDCDFAHEADMMLQEKIDGVALLLLKRSDILDYLHLKMGPALKLYKHIYKIQYRFCPCNRPPVNY